MALAFIHIQMEGNTKVIMLMIREKGKENINGRTELCTKENGRMVDSMAWGYIYVQMVSNNQANGKMGYE